MVVILYIEKRIDKKTGYRCCFMWFCSSFLWSLWDTYTLL